MDCTKHTNSYTSPESSLYFSPSDLFSKVTKQPREQSIGHGIGLLLILLGGFGMQAKMKDVYQAVYGSGFPTWLIIKIVIWLALGGGIVLAKTQNH